MPRIVLWVYGVTGTLYFLMWVWGDDLVEQYAVGPALVAETSITIDRCWHVCS